MTAMRSSETTRCSDAKYLKRLSPSTHLWIRSSKKKKKKVAHVKLVRNVEEEFPFLKL